MRRIDNCSAKSKGVRGLQGNLSRLSSLSAIFGSIATYGRTWQSECHPLNSAAAIERTAGWKQVGILNPFLGVSSIDTESAVKAAIICWTANRTHIISSDAQAQERKNLAHDSFTPLSAVFEEMATILERRLLAVKAIHSPTSLKATELLG